MEETKFCLTPILNEQGEYSLTGFADIVSVCEMYINERLVSEIKTPEDLKLLKNNRKLIRAKLNTIRKTRLNLVKTFSFQFIALEKMLEEADNQMKKIKDDYEQANEEKETVQNDSSKTVLLQITYFNEKSLEKIKELAVKENCAIVEIKEK